MHGTFAPLCERSTAGAAFTLVGVFEAVYSSRARCNARTNSKLIAFKRSGRLSPIRAIPGSGCSRSTTATEVLLLERSSGVEDNRLDQPRPIHGFSSPSIVGSDLRVCCHFLAIERPDGNSQGRQRVEADRYLIGELGRAVAQSHRSFDHLLKRLELMLSQPIREEHLGSFGPHTRPWLYRVDAHAVSKDLGGEGISQAIEGSFAAP